MIKIYREPQIDYDGEIDVDWYEERYPIERKRYLMHGNTAIVGMNNDLESMCRRWRMGLVRGESFERKIRSQTQLIEDLLEGM